MILGCTLYMCKDIDDQNIHNILETKYPFTLYIDFLKQYTLYCVQCPVHLYSETNCTVYMNILKPTVQCT